MAFPGNANKVADVVCIVFIFIYAMGYSLGLGPAAWVYSSEVGNHHRYCLRDLQAADRLRC